ncbi:MAG: sulfatase-like hydrolase/transferase, partial [Akkermansiaceae bacterium]
MKKALFLFLFPFTLNAATYVWTAEGDGVSLYQEANWTLNGDGVNVIPQINPATAVNHDLIVNSGTPGGGGGGSNTLNLGTGSLTVNGGTLRMSLGNGAGITQGPISQTGGTIIAQFISNSAVTLSSGTLTLGGSGNPINSSTVEFPTGSDGEILSTETPTDFISEHLGKITVNGSPAVIGTNFEVIDDGSGGSIARLIPSPADTDADGLDDNWEQTYFGNLTTSDGSGDFENDGLNELAEFNAGTIPTDPDSDDDLLRDGEEVNTYNTNPALADTDGDSNPDGFEISKGTDPNNNASKTNRPNIIFIFADDLGWGDLGVLWQNGKSGKKHKTPFFDQMAADGMILNRHYCPAPVCAPSRASLLSGLHQGHANIRNNQFDKELEDNHNLANTLRKVGYSTSLIGKWGTQGGGGSPAAWPAYPTKRGFDYFFGYVRHGDGHTHYPDHVTDSRGKKELYDQNSQIGDDLDKCFTPDLFTARAKKLIIDEVNDGDEQPFFLYLAYDTPHAALQLPTIAYPGWNSSNDIDDSGFGVSGGVQWLGVPGNMINTATGTIDSYRHSDYTTAVGNAWTDVEERQASLIRRMDDNIGDLRKTLEDLGIANNTLIVFSSDNGPHSEDYLSNAQTNDGSSYLPPSFDSYGPFEGQKRDCWEGGIREPSLAVWPGTITAGSLTDLPSQLHDWLPTFCELAGATPPARTDGVSLVPTLTGTGTQKTPTTYVEYSTNGNTPNWGDFNVHGGTTRSQAQVIFLDGYKGIRNNPANADVDFRIYDVRLNPGYTSPADVVDPEEANNLSNTTVYFTELNQRMKDRVLQIRQPDSSATRPWDSANVPPSTDLPTLTPGTHYQTFTGLWNWVPEFTELTETTSGERTNIDLSVLPASTQARGYLQTGYLNIPSSGLWTFTINSDSGSFLR